jgi:FAD/FMN-containing dehydrogenase
MISVINDWDVGDATQHRAWTQAFWRDVRPYASGVYVNFLEQAERARIREAYPGDTYARLAAVKRAYDPHNVFNLNQNIQPN